MDVGALISRQRRRLGMTLEELGNKVGVGKSTVRKWETGYIENMKRDKIAALASALQIKPMLLLGCDEEKDATLTKRIPLLGSIAAGAPIEAVENADDWLTVDERDDVNFALRVQGDSMTGVGIYDGDIIYVRTQPMVNNGDIAVVLKYDDYPDSSDVTCKRFYQYGKTVLLRPESHNPDHKDQEITLGKGINVRVLGKVIFLKSHIEGR